jgi:uridine kinase
MIGITGESASGKSTICKRIRNVIDKFNMPVSILTTDNYFNDISGLIKEYGTFDNLRDHGYDVDSPNSFQLDVLTRDLEKISQGEDIYSPEYLLNGTGVSVPNVKLVKTNKIVVVEGMASMYVENKDIYDIKIYVETDLETRRKWFLERAHTERNQDLENAKKHWEYIMVAGEKYVKPYRSQADIIINGASNLTYFTQILEYIYTITNNFDD